MKNINNFFSLPCSSVVSAMNDVTNVDVSASVVFRIFRILMHWMFEYLLFLSSLLMPFEAIHMQNLI